MSHYDDIREKEAERRSKATKARTGLTPREHDRLVWLQEEIRKYNEFMNIEAKIAELRKLKRKMRKEK